jgi:hypothetical protein
MCLIHQELAHFGPKNATNMSRSTSSGTQCSRTL